jgi:HTH-type transcriptional regulator/antitoxin HigA
MTTKIKVIKTEEDYKEALKLVEELMISNPAPDTEDGERLDLLVTLIQDYESKIFPDNLPDPIEAIKFRMEQQNLKPVDLIPYLGSRSRVSEILSGERQLTVEMMRALEEGLGIPAKVLIKKPQKSDDAIFSTWDNKLLRKMWQRGYFGQEKITRNNGAELVRNFFDTIGTPMQLGAMLRQSSYRSAPSTDRNALAAWAAYVIKKASSINSEKYIPGKLDLETMRELAKLSANDNGPVLVQGHLKKYGIVLVIEPAFEKTRLDGATIFANKEKVIIGLTLRHDRLDNFWFTLMHELAHVALHYKEGIDLFYDELDDIKKINSDEKEEGADRLASEALVPASKWEVSPAKLIPSPLAANSLANELGVHVAIIAGKIRYEGEKYTYLNKIIANARVRNYFPGIKWD